MTPMVKLRCARRERAKKFGRYLYFLTAAKILSLVSCGMESATREPLMTSDTVAGERSRRAASSFRLTGLRLIGSGRPVAFPVSLPVDFPDALPLLPIVTLRSLAQTESLGKRGLNS